MSTYLYNNANWFYHYIDFRRSRSVRRNPMNIYNQLIPFVGHMMQGVPKKSVPTGLYHVIYQADNFWNVPATGVNGFAMGCTVAFQDDRSEGNDRAVILLWGPSLARAATYHEQLRRFRIYLRYDSGIGSTGTTAGASWRKKSMFVNMLTGQRKAVNQQYWGHHFEVQPYKVSSPYGPGTLTSPPGQLMRMFSGHDHQMRFKNNFSYNHDLDYYSSGSPQGRIQQRKCREDCDGIMRNHHHHLAA